VPAVSDPLHVDVDLSVVGRGEKRREQGNTAQVRTAVTVAAVVLVW